MLLAPFYEGPVAKLLLRVRVRYRYIPFLVFIAYWVAPGLIVLACSASSRAELNSAAALYLRDYTHFLFSVLVALGALPVYITVKKVRPVVRHTLRVVQSKAEEVHWGARYLLYRNAAFSDWIAAMCLLLSISSFGIILTRAFDPAYEAWWGNIAQGWAGFYFAVIVFQMVLWGTWSFFVSTAASLTISQIARCKFRYDPLRADGCNGLRPVGYLIVLMWAYALCVSAAIFVVFSQGYLGLERDPSIWFISIIGSLCTPLVAILPLISVTRAIYKARNLYLLNLEKGVQTLSLPKSSRDAAKINEFMTLMESIRSGNIFPFRSRTVLLLTTLNIIQVGLSYNELART